jgi:hypothetical protein
MKDPKYVIGEEVELIKDYNGNDSKVKAGERFIIRDFPPCVRNNGTQFSYFLYGKTKDGRHCRSFIEEVKQITNDKERNSNSSK